MILRTPEEECVFGLDNLIAALAAGHAPLVALAVAALLGLRHATDPDHLVAVSALVAGGADRPVRRASLLGLGWGLGHATTLLVAGLPVVLLGRVLPERLRASAEILVGVVIMALALRLIFRWRQGRFHVHVHAHGDVFHRHLHAHEPARSGHAHDHVLLRSPVQAYGIGLVHGLGGSAAVGLFLMASITGRATAAAALVVFAVGTAVSMSLLSSGFGYALARGPIRQRLQRLIPALGALSLAFGAWYAAGAIGTVV
jgi:sulfite exporter TauE/SafE